MATNCSQTVILPTREGEEVDLLRWLGDNDIAFAVFDGEFEESPALLAVGINFVRHGGCAITSMVRSGD